MNTALLTIDDIASRNTPALVDYLTEKGIPAILFATGMNVEKYYEEALYAVKKGFVVGNHSYSHPGFSSLSMEDAVTDIEKCEEVLNRLYQDASVPRLYRPFRFPYGDKGGKNKDALQQHLKQQHFDKVDDTHLPYPWWKESGLHRDIDTLWTFDFEEYRLPHDPAFTKDSIWAKMQAVTPSSGAALYGENNRHIVLLHAHDETEAVLPRYYQLFLDELIKNGITFDAPAFIRQEAGKEKSSCFIARL